MMMVHLYHPSSFLYTMLMVPLMPFVESPRILLSRKQAEEALHKTVCIFENLYDAILTDLEYRIIDWNPAKNVLT